MKKLYYLIILTVILGLVLTGCFLSNVGQVPTSGQSGIAYLTKHTADGPYKTDLLAGQTLDVGDVLVWNDGDNLYVKYVTNDGWCLTETHLHVAESWQEIPQTKKNNPIPGHFDYNGEHDCVTEFLYPPIPLATWVSDTVLFIAAHAVVQKTTIITESPYYASVVVDSSQGLTKGGGPVDEERSVPEQGLVFETGRDPSNFFSLGFGGWIIVEFDCPIQNGDGNDIKIIEDTWGSYPLEKADVYASQDGTIWTWLGKADNTNAVGIHTFSEFDLGILSWAKYIKIEDTCDPALHNSAADGYDLNAVESLQDCVEIQEETAWGAGFDFPGKNWATYFTYKVQGWHLIETLTIEANSTTGESSSVLELGKSYMFKASSTWQDNSTPNHYIDAEYTSFDLPVWDVPTDGTTNWGPDQKDLQVNELFVDWGAYSGDHIYTLMFDGTGLIVNFRVFDGKANASPPDMMSGWYPDNEGSLTVEIFEWY